MLERFIEIVAAMADELGLSWRIALSGCAGSLLSLVALDAVTTMRVRFVTFGSGIAISWFGTPAVGQFWDISKPAVLAGIALLLGLYGLSIVQELFAFIKTGAIRSLINAFINIKLKVKPDEHNSP